MDSSVELVRHLLQSVVYIHTTVGRDHPSTRILGNERLGSGVVVDASGLILTVNYVVMGSQSIYVAFQKGRRVKAELVAQDFEIGLALIRVNRQGLVAADVGTGEAGGGGDAAGGVGGVRTGRRRAPPRLAQRLRARDPGRRGRRGRGARRPRRSRRAAGVGPDRLAQRRGGGESPGSLHEPLAS